jgi:hypothetical protein
MARYTGQLSIKGAEKAFPNVVEMQIPGDGLCLKSDAIESWRVKRGIDFKNGQGSNREGVWFARYCFLPRDDAEAFVTLFGGQLLGLAALSRSRKRRGQR